MIKPKALKSGDLVAVIAPASPYEQAALEKGMQALQSLGLVVRPPPPLTPYLGYLAATDQERLQQVQAAFTDKEVKGVFCARGGYGTMRLIMNLKPEIIAKNPKVFVGYSDISTFLNLLTVHASFITFHGPVVAKDLDTETRPKTLALLERAVMRTEPLGEIHARDLTEWEPVALHPGQARGILVGGNLSLMAASLGTPFEIQTDGKIFFLEEVAERPYRIDRLLQQLLLAKKFNRVAGVVLGEFVDCFDPPGEGQMRNPPLERQRLLEILQDVLTPLGVPILYGFPAGHCAEKVTLPLGVIVELDADRAVLNILESGVL